MLQRLARALFDLCFPARCAGCGEVWLAAGRGSWCPSCRDALPKLAPPLCTTCGRPFVRESGEADRLCGACIDGRFRFDGARSAVFHEGPVRDGINRLKFGGSLFWAVPLAELLTGVVKEAGFDRRSELAIPVPLHVKRLRQRGFNQSALLAERALGPLGVPLERALLVRNRWTDPQTRLGRRERHKNVKGAFSVNDVSKVKGRRILLVDDVFTTGTTLNECAGVLKRAGALSVYAVTVSRAAPGRLAEESRSGG